MDARRFLEALRRHPTKKIPIRSCRESFFAVFPEATQAPDVEQRIGSLLAELEKEGTVKLPSRRTPRAWDPALKGLPQWFWVNAIVPPKLPPVLPDDFPWLPELRQLGLTSRGSQRQDLVRINEYLCKHRHDLRLIPLRERSLQIFGDERKLSSMLADGSLLDGRLPLALIGAFDPPLPFCAEGPPHPAPGRPILVLENHHTYASFLEANKRWRVYAAVAYGVGNAFSKSAAGIDEVVSRYQGSHIHYFGDLDGQGILTPWRVSHSRIKRGLEPVQPARFLYTWVIRHGIRRPVEGRIKDRARDAVRLWVGDDLAEEIMDLWDGGKRIPQESLGTEQLDLVLGSALLRHEAIHREIRAIHERDARMNPE